MVDSFPARRAMDEREGAGKLNLNAGKAGLIPGPRREAVLDPGCSRLIQ